jgi:hypothetical protein
MERIRTIAIVLGDNDFGNTFRPLLQGLKPIFEYRGEFELTPAQLEVVIRRSVMTYYVGYQYRFDDGCYGDGKNHLYNIEKYFEGIKVLFNEAAENDIATADHDGGAWYLELQSGTVAGY